MINVSETYNPYSTIRDVDTVIKMKATNEEARINAENYAFQYMTSYSNPFVEDYEQINWATCENEYTKLDGTYRYFDSISGQKGVWSTILSDSEGKFTEHKPWWGIYWENSAYDIVGLTIRSDPNSYIKKATILIETTRGTLFNETVEATNGVMEINVPAHAYLITITVEEVSDANRFAKILSFEFGITKTWNRDKLISAKVEEEADFLGEALPINKLTFEVDNSMGEFNLDHSTKEFVDKTILKFSTISSNSINPISRIDRLKDYWTTTNFATCENEYTDLSGNYKYFPDNGYTYYGGYLSGNLSDAEGEFINHPTITYSWRSYVNFSALRIIFNNNVYATELTVTAYHDNSIIDSISVQNEDMECLVDFGVEDCNKVVFEFSSTNDMYRYLRVRMVEFLRYADSWFSYLVKDTPISCTMIVNGEEINMGNNYFFESAIPKNNNLTAEIVAHNYIYNFDNQTYTDGATGTITLSNAINGILNNTGITANYGVPSSTTVSRATPKDTTKRAAMHYFSQASMATCYLDRNNILQIKSFDIGQVVDALDKNNIYDFDIVNLSDYVNMIRLTVKDEYTDPETEHTYRGGSGLYYREIQNNCVYSGNGTSVANWLLEQYKRRKYFEITSRGNPALEIGDTIKITDKSGVSALAVIYKHVIDFSINGLKSEILAVADIF